MSKKRIGALSADKKKLLEKLLKDKGVARSAETKADESQHDASSGLSFGQERLWFLSQLEPMSASYNMPAALRLGGPLDRTRLAESLTALLQRHEVLRTRYEIDDGAPRAVVDDAIAASLDVATMSGDAMARYAARPFDLERGPVVRFQLLEVSPDEHVLLMNLHHIAGDQWSLAIMQREVMALYGGQTLPAPAMSYAAFARRQRARVAAGELDDQLAFWRATLADCPEELALPFDRQRPAVARYRGARVPLSLPLERARAFAREHKATAFMVVLAGLFALLRRLTRASDLVVGTPIANRNRAETENVVGFFANTLALRAKVAGDSTLSSLLAQVKGAALDAYDHQDIPFETVVDALNPQRAVTRSPLFQVLFAYAEQAPSSVSVAGLVVEPLALDSATARFDLTVTGDFIEYASDLFERSTIERIADQYAALLEAALAAPDVPLSALSPAGDAPVVAGPAREPPADVIASFVAQDGSRAALEHAGQSVSYTELEARSRAFAAGLVARSIGRGDVVAIEGERSIETIVALLGVLRAGAAYMPIDPRLPQARIDFMVRDAGAVVLASNRLEPLDGDPEQTLPALRAGDAAYVIYTSGSTGTPNGVMISHGAIANTTRALVDELGVDASDRVMQLVSLSFDVSASEIFMALTSGATLVLAAQDDLNPGPAMLTMLDDLRISVMSIPASVLVACGYQRLVSLRALIVGGEVCPDDVVERWSQGRQLFNCYGPTEAAVTTTMCEASRGAFAGIGVPIDNVRCYVLDEQGARLPTGVAGELAIAGVGLAMSYVARPGLTARKFVPDLVAAGERMYLTGDLARLRPDGAIEFLGRIDEQVKVRGHRVHLSEVEALLADVVVGVVGTRLVAYTTGETTLTELQARVRGQLPEYMVPASLVTLAAFPRTTSGKIDRRILAQSAGTLEHKSRSGAPPRDDIERQLVAIWQDVLAVEAVGIHDDFFDVGGNSFVILKLLTAIKKATGLSLPMQVVFESGSVAQMAELLRTEQRSKESSRSLVTMQKGAGLMPLAVVHPVGGNVLCYGRLLRLLAKDRPVFGLQARGAEGDLPPRRDIVVMADAYVDELVSVYPEGPCALLGWSLGGTVAFEMARVLMRRGREVSLLCMLDSTGPLAARRTVKPAELLAQLLRDFTVTGLLGGGPLPPLGELLSMPLEAIEDVVVERVAGLGIFPEGDERAAVRRLVALYRGHMDAHLRYHPRPYDGSVWYVTASASRRDVIERWRQLTRGPFDELVIAQSTHQSLLRPPHVEQLAEALQARLSSASR